MASHPRRYSSSVCLIFIFWRIKAPDKFHYEFTNIKWIKQNSTPPPLPLSGVHTPQQNFTLRQGKLAQCRQGQHLRKALWRAPWRYVLFWHYSNPYHRFKSNNGICTSDIYRALAFCRSTTVEPWTFDSFLFLSNYLQFTRQCHGQTATQITGGCMYSRENSWWWADVARNMSSSK
jgi:hypothetical protein